MQGWRGAWGEEEAGPLSRTHTDNIFHCLWQYNNNGNGRRMMEIPAQKE